MSSTLNLMNVRRGRTHLAKLSKVRFSKCVAVVSSLINFAVPRSLTNFTTTLTNSKGNSTESS